MQNSIIEEDLTIEGDIKSEQGHVEIKGKVIGDVTAKSVTIHINGSIDGALKAATVNVEGSQTGSIDCTDLTLTATSNVRADVIAQTMTAQSGGSLAGKLQVTGKT